MNGLSEHHLFPIDHTVHGAEKEIPDVRTVVHLSWWSNRARK